MRVRKHDLPEYRDNVFIAGLPPLLSPLEVIKALRERPRFAARERRDPAYIRLHCIWRMLHFFEPLDCHLQLESVISLAIRQGYLGRDIGTGDYFQQLQHGHKRIGIRPAAISPALIGCSGMGKTESMERILDLYPQVIHLDVSCSLDQVVWLKLDCPYKGSLGQLCQSFFSELDRLLHTQYCARHSSKRTSIDIMMRDMQHLARLHAVGILVIDEIQHLAQTPGTGPEAMLNFLLTLVNTIGIPVVFIGTLDALPLLLGTFRQARRALGIPPWERMDDGPSWRHLVEQMWPYQWTQETTPLTDKIRQVLYKECQGIIDLLIKLFMLAQWRALALGPPERLDVGLLEQVAREEFAIIRPMILALQRGDKQALVRYGDLRRLQDHMRQAFSKALAGVSQPRPRGA